MDNCEKRKYIPIYSPTPVYFCNHNRKSQIYSQVYSRDDCSLQNKLVWCVLPEVTTMVKYT